MGRIKIVAEGNNFSFVDRSATERLASQIDMFKKRLASMEKSAKTAGKSLDEFFKNDPTSKEHYKRYQSKLEELTAKRTVQEKSGSYFIFTQDALTRKYADDPKVASLVREFQKKWGEEALEGNLINIPFPALLEEKTSKK